MEFDDDVQDARDAEDQCIEPKWLGRDVPPVPHSQKDDEDKRNEDEEESVDPFDPRHGVHRWTRWDNVQRINVGILCFVFTDRSRSARDRRTSHSLPTSTTNIDVERIELEPDSWPGAGPYRLGCRVWSRAGNGLRGPRGSTRRTGSGVAIGCAQDQPPFRHAGSPRFVELECPRVNARA